MCPVGPMGLPCECNLSHGEGIGMLVSRVTVLVITSGTFCCNLFPFGLLFCLLGEYVDGWFSCSDDRICAEITNYINDIV